jgi:hypothetical protein
VKDKDYTVWHPALGDPTTYLTGLLAGVRATLVALKKEEETK